MNQLELYKKLKFVIHAAAKKDVRYYLKGIMLELDNMDIKCLVATDGHRLALAGGRGAKRGDYDEIIICNDSIKLLLQALKPGAGKLGKARAEQTEVKIVVDIIASVATVNLIYRDSAASYPVNLVDGRYPDYRRVIPKPDDIQPGYDIGWNAAHIAQACTALDGYSDNKTTTIKMSHYSGLMTLEYNDAFALIMHCKLK